MKNKVFFWCFEKKTFFFATKGLFSFDLNNSKFFRYISSYSLLCLHFSLNKNDIRHLLFVRQVLLCCRKAIKELHWTYMYRCTSTILFYEIVSNMSRVKNVQNLSWISNFFNEFCYGKNCLFWWCWWFLLNFFNCFPTYRD